MQKMYIASMMLIGLLPALPQAIGQGSKVKITATGTGNTTGHIANLSVHNMDKTDIRINEQAVYIPSDGQYQPYITTIPERTIPPGVTTIPLSGYCADVTTPPVPTGVAIPSVEDWVATVPDVLPRPGSGGINVVEKIVPQFSVKDIPAITGSPGFTPKPPPSIPGIQPTWPGSDSIVGGTINPVKDPVIIAPVLIDAISNIASAYDKLRNDGKITTPFSGDPAKERVSVIQQTFWIFTSALTSKKYDKENFGDKVVEQFETNTGTKVSAMPEPEKKKLDDGVDAFWNTFVATGVEAKVINAPASTDDNSVPVQDTKTDKQPSGNTDKKEKKKGKCACTSMEIDYVLNIENKTGNMISEKSSTQTVTFEKGKSEVVLAEIKATEVNVKEGKKVTLTVTPELKCTCSEEGGKCPEGAHTITIMHKKEELKKEFTLGAVPYVIDVTVTQKCKGEDCDEISCSVKGKIKIELDKDKNKPKGKDEKK